MNVNGFKKSKKVIAMKMNGVGKVKECVRKLQKKCEEALERQKERKNKKKCTGGTRK